MQHIDWPTLRVFRSLPFLLQIETIWRANSGPRGAVDLGAEAQIDYGRLGCGLIPVLADYVCGLVVTNDVSARDVQLTKTQFSRRKSYPTFTPVGPALVLVDADELKRFGDLRLLVNGQTRQDVLVDGDMIYPPVQALQALSRFQCLDAGDLVLTGTPVGTAISAPPKPAQVVSSLLPEELKWKILLRPGQESEVSARRRRGRSQRGHR